MSEDRASGGGGCGCGTIIIIILLYLILKALTSSESPRPQQHTGGHATVALVVPSRSTNFPASFLHTLSNTLVVSN